MASNMSLFHLYLTIDINTGAKVFNNHFTNWTCTDKFLRFAILCGAFQIFITC